MVFGDFRQLPIFTPTRWLRFSFSAFNRHVGTTGNIREQPGTSIGGDESHPERPTWISSSRVIRILLTTAARAHLERSARNTREDFGMTRWRRGETRSPGAAEAQPIPPRRRDGREGRTRRRKSACTCLRGLASRASRLRGCLLFRREQSNHETTQCDPYRRSTTRIFGCLIGAIPCPRK